MRILILTGVFPPDIGGPATQLDALSRELIKADYQVRILTFGRKDKVQYPYSVKRVCNYWPSFIKSFLYLIKGLFFALQADILYSYDLYTAGLTSLIAKKLLRKPLIIRFVGDSAWEIASVRGLINEDIVTFQENKYSWSIELRKKIRKKILDNSDKVIVVSHFLKDLAQKIGLPQEKIKVIYNSIDFLEVKSSSLTKEELKQKLGFKEVVLLTVARLIPWKGIDMLIEIMPDLIKKYRQIDLVIVGRGPEMNKLKQLTQELGLENNVHFTGKLDREQIIDYLKMADLFALNTNYEGMSHVLLEAMKIGVPIITTKAGGNPETIKDGQTGLLVD
jgi:glycosyltransferase involved in cell wall biosynthesis